MSDESQRPMTQQQLEDEPAQYSEKSALGSGMKSLATGAGAGVFLSAIQNSLAKHDHGAMGIFTRSGGTISLLAATAGMFGFTEAAVANLRGKDDPINGAAGGCAAGLVVGANARSLPVMVGSCAGLAALVGTFDAAGGSLMGDWTKENTVADGLANLGHGADDHTAGESGMRQIREERRRRFFKHPQQQETSSE